MDQGQTFFPAAVAQDLSPNFIAKLQLRIVGREVQAAAHGHFEIAEPDLVESIAAIAEAGIPVMALGSLPRRAPGLHDAKARDERVRAAAVRLAGLVVRVPAPEALEALLEQHVKGTVVEPPPGVALRVSLEQRRSLAGDTLLVFNESWKPRHARLRFTRAGGVLMLWDPRTGSRVKLREQVEAGDVVPLELESAETVILTLLP